MKIGIAGPVDVHMLNMDIGSHELANDFPFPMYSMLANNLIDRGFQVVIFTLSAHVKEVVEFKNHALTLCIAPARPNPGRRFFNHEVRVLSELMTAHNPDVIHALWSYEFAMAAQRTGLPYVVSLQDHATTILKFHKDPYRTVRWFMNYFVLKKTRHLIANSQYLFNLLDKKQQTKARIIYNFYPKDLEMHFKDSQNKGNYILSISNGFGKRKNIQNSILAFSKLHQKYPWLEYRIVGIDMEVGGPANEFAVSRGVEEGIKFVGKLPFEEVIKEIVRAKVVVHPSLEESFGMSVLEPLVIGTPVVGGIRSGNVPYLLGLGKTGRVCDVLDPEDIAREVSYLLDNEKKAEDIRTRAFEFARDNFNEDLIVQRHIDAYKEVLFGQSNARPRFAYV